VFGLNIHQHFLIPFLNSFLTSFAKHNL